MTTIQDTLRLFGITHCYKGYNHMVYAVQLVMEDESRLEAVTKELYMETAEHFGCKWYSVVSATCARSLTGREDKQPAPVRDCRYNLDHSPTVSEFIEIMATHIMRSSETPAAQRTS